MTAAGAPLISACLIVRDEEANLPRCLASLEKAVDEIVVVDTGSLDATPEIARQFGGRLFHYAWSDDFSAARNESLRRATGRWLLWIDADEALVEPKSGTLRELCSRHETDWGYYLDVHCPNSEDVPAETIGRQWRLFPRDAGVRFEGRVHEHPVAPRTIRPEDVLPHQGACIYHWGYIPRGDALQRKQRRNRRLIELSLAEEPTQPRHYFNLGQALIGEGDDSTAQGVLLQGIDAWFAAHGADTGYVPPLFSFAATLSNRLGQPQTAIDIAARTPAAFVSSELLLAAGLACRALGRTEEAIRHLRRAVADPLAINNIFADRDSPNRALQELRETGASTISACLIVKNEEANLPRCLSSIRAAVDEIVVVDTGSSDRTVEIAQSFGARTFFFEWCDDFSAARNESLKHASGEYIMWIDADDELIEPEPGAVRQLCASLPAESWGFLVDVHCPTDEWGEGEAILKQGRVFRNHLDVRFHGRLHEQAAPPAERNPGPLTPQDKVRIKHWGYIADGEVSKRRSERNERILRRMIAQEPKENFHLYNLGLQYAGDRKYRQALKTMERAIELWAQRPEGPDGYVASMFGIAVLSAVELERYEKALAIEARTPAQYVSTDLLHHAAVAWWRLGHAGEALSRFQRALTDASLVNPNVHDRSTSTWRPLLMMACLYFEQDDFSHAYDAAQQALQYAPTKPQTLFIMAHAARELGKRDEAINWSRQLIHGDRDEDYKPKARRLLLNLANELDDASLALEALSGEIEDLEEAGATYLRARALGMIGEIRQQAEMLLQGCKRFPKDADIRLALADVLEKQGLFDETMTVLASGLDYNPVPAQLYRRLAVLLAHQGQLADAANALQLAEAAKLLGNDLGRAASSSGRTPVGAHHAAA